MAEETTLTDPLLDPKTAALLRRHGVLRTLLTAMVTEELIDGDALDDAARQQALRAYRQRQGLTSAEALKQHCLRQGFGPDDLRWQAELPERIRRRSQQHASKAEQHYLSRKEQFDQVTYRQLAAPNQFLAQELFLRINENEADFDSLAAELNRSGSQSKLPSRVGPIPLAKVPEPLAKPLRSSTPGTLLQPIEVGNQWLVVQLEQFRATQFDAAMEQRMCLELFQASINQAVNQRLQQLQPSRNGSS